MDDSDGDIADDSAGGRDENEEEYADAPEIPLEHDVAEGEVQANVVLAPTSGSRRIRTNIVPKLKDGVKKATPRLYQRSRVVRNARSKYPTEILNGINWEKIGVKAVMEGNSPVQKLVTQYLELVHTYLGYYPSTLTFEVLEARIQASTKAPDESDSEHFQRITSALQIISLIKSSNISNLKDIIELVLRQVSETQQHERYEEALRIKDLRNNSEIAKIDAETLALRQKLDIEATEDAVNGDLHRHLNGTITRQRIAGAINDYASVPFQHLTDIDDEPCQYFIARTNLLR